MTPVMRKHFLILMFFEVFLANLTLGKSGVSTDIFFGCLLREVRQGCQLCFRRVLWPVLLRSGEQGSAMEENDQDSLPSKMIDVIQHRCFCGPARTASQYIYRFYDTYVLVLLHMLESGLSQVWNNIHVEGVVDLFQAIVHDLIVDGAAYIFRFLRFIFVSFKWITVCPCHIYFDPKVYLFLCRDLYIYIYIWYKL